MATLNIKNLPDALYQRLKLRAKQQRRSVAQEVTHILAERLAEPKLRSIQELRGLGKELWHDVDGTAHVADERGSWD